MEYNNCTIFWRIIMSNYKIVEIKEDITSRNNLFAKEIKKELMISCDLS